MRTRTTCLETHSGVIRKVLSIIIGLIRPNDDCISKCTTNDSIDNVDSNTHVHVAYAKCYAFNYVK